MLQNILLVVHVLVAAAIVGLVLLQQGKGADAGAAFGSGASSTVFGARGSASFLSRTTAILAAVFFATSIGLAYLAGKESGPRSVVDTVVTEEQPAAPAQEQPAPPAPESDVPVSD